ncbi:MAG: hypothetical protein E7D37_14970 [Enterobacter cloacae]|nr:hypothetical protein [Enterobacter cloacae]MDU2521860.1 hypothetical protein [Enterobacter cloacae]MDU2668735.1 hypothetical protein [Enterobacter cloacae]
MTAREKIFYFWGVMDVIGAVYYTFDSWGFLGGDWVSALVNLALLVYVTWFGGVDDTLQGTYYLVYVLIPLALLFSAWFFFKKKHYAVKFSLSLEVLRIITLRSSVPLFPMIAGGLGWGGLKVNISLLVLSEIVKIGSLIYLIKSQPAINKSAESE